jgi:hypothetical protein
MDSYLAYVPRHVKHVLNRLGLDRSQNQNVKNKARSRLETVLTIPTELELRERKCPH